MKLLIYSTSLLFILSSFSVNTDCFSQANELYQTGIKHHDSNNLSEALSYYLKAHYYMMKTDSVTKQIYLKNDIGIVFRSAGNPGAALTFYDQALELSPDKFSEIMLKYNKSGALMDLGQYDEALILLNYCYLNTPEFNSRKANIINKMGLILSKIEDYPNASEHFFFLRNNAEYLGKDSTKYLARAYHNLGDLHYKQQDYRQAQEFFRLAIENKPVKNEWHVLSLVDLGEISYLLGDYHTAIKSLNSASYISDSLAADLSFNDIRIDKFLYRSYDSLGMKDKAVHHLLAFEDNVDRYNSTIRKINVEEQRIRSQIIYDNFIKDLERQEQMMFWYWVTGSGTILAILLIVLIVRRERNKGRKTLLEIQRITNSI